MSQTFESIEIDGAFIKEFAFTPSEEVRVILLRAPQQDSDEQVTTRSELKFYKAHACHANFRAQPWLEIKSHESLNRLNYEEQRGLQELKGQNLSSSEESFRVFRILCEEGEITIFADAFGFTMIERIPHFDWSEMP